LVFRQDGKPVDTWDSIRWDAPGCFLLDVGAHAPGATKAEGSGLYAVHLLTPETATSTHYNFSAVRQNMAAGARPSPEISRKIGEMRRDIFINQDAKRSKKISAAIPTARNTRRSFQPTPVPPGNGASCVNS
jgi:vanillate O-demethylase monooxygenase subunit